MTTSATISLHLEGSGVPLLKACVHYTTKLHQLRALKPPLSSLASTQDVESDLIAAWHAMQPTRTPRNSAGRTPRCPSCKKFTRRVDRCDHCGYDNQRGWT